MRRAGFVPLILPDARGKRRWTGFGPVGAGCENRGMPGYAVLDLETTGFSPRRGDRIVEIGIVLLDEQGRSQGEWGTLIQPWRDVGATSVHHITDRDVAAAPTLEQVTGRLIAQLRGRLVIAHNASFDVSFLDTELRRVGAELPPEPMPSVCTMRLGRTLLSPRPPTFKLADCCRAAGVSLRHAHSALGDARATAELFGVYLDIASALDGPAPWSGAGGRAEHYAWPVGLADPVDAPLLLRS
ncbi:DNA polymerase III polC-type [Propionibacterium australiense]|uniref:Ribonuclease H-like domain n=1 Tax=Propionibacterium australiense TaxID=119981 RepID=A0A383S7W6_9ACTN|nr:Ribonuclease H-like domain [Propionibacterium australiense]VEH88684.1 DNA polymerase III polC-type [Propionibacterium australiense]